MANKSPTKLMLDTRRSSAQPSPNIIISVGDHDENGYEEEQNGRDSAMQTGTEEEMHGSQSYLPTKRLERTLLAQVKNLDARSRYYKQKIQDIMNRIVSTIASWELFSDE